MIYVDEQVEDMKLHVPERDLSTHLALALVQREVAKLQNELRREDKSWGA